MAPERIAGPITRTRLRVLARTWSAAVFLLFVAFALSIGPPVSPDGPGSWAIVQQTMVIGGGLWVLLALRWEGVGGLLLTFAGILLGVLAAVGFPPLQALAVTLLYLVPGLSYLTLWATQHHWLVPVGTALLVVAGLTAGGFAASRIHNYYFGPAHPQSQISAPPPSLVTWAWSGALTSTSIRVNAQIAGDAGSARLAISRDTSFARPVWSVSQPITTDTNRVASFAIDDLDPDTSYHYAVEVNGQLDLVRTGQFTTPPDAAFSFSVALGSCARVGSNGAVYEAIRRTQPLLFLALGDIHYGNIDTNSRSEFREVMDETLTSPAQAELFRSTPIAYLWDDHDFGGNNSDSTSAGAPAAQATYREYVPHYELADDNGAIYQAFTIGRIRFLVTDTRSARLGDTLLGDVQVEWLKQEMIAARDTHALTVWANSVPWIAAETAGADHWGGYPEERAEIAEFIAVNGLAPHLVMLAGDAHMLAIDNGTNSDYSASGTAGFPIFHAAALDRPGSVKGGPYSEGSFPGAGQFGLMSVDDDGSDSITVSWQGYNWELNEIVSLELNFDIE